MRLRAAAVAYRDLEIPLFHVKLNLSASRRTGYVHPSPRAMSVAPSPLANLVPPFSRMGRNQRERGRSYSFDPGSLRKGLRTKQSEFRAHFVRQPRHGREVQSGRNQQQFIASVALDVC